jgi:glucose/mannose transport system substrate-binding protein
MQYGKDYGSFPVPGTNGIYGLVTDTFQHPKGTTHPTNSDRWLKVVASREGQDAFNPIKGSIPARNDPDLSLYDTYQKEAIADFTSAQSMYPSVTHGSGAPESFKLKLIEVVTSFSSSLNSLEAASSLTDFTVGHLGEYTKTWNLK